MVQSQLNHSGSNLSQVMHLDCTLIEDNMRTFLGRNQSESFPRREYLKEICFLCVRVESTLSAARDNIKTTRREVKATKQKQQQQQQPCTSHTSWAIEAVEQWMVFNSRVVIICWWADDCKRFWKQQLGHSLVERGAHKCRLMSCHAPGRKEMCVNPQNLRKLFGMGVCESSRESEAHARSENQTILLHFLYYKSRPSPFVRGWEQQ